MLRPVMAAMASSRSGARSTSRKAAPTAATAGADRSMAGSRWARAAAMISMLADFPGTVETSTNLASVKKSDQLIEIKILTRSSSESRKEQICSSLESVFALAGAKVEYGSSYGGWQPNIKSEILGVMQRVYEQKFGRTPNVKVMHAGLECGIIQTVYPDMDMISFGPDLQYPHSPDERVSISSVQKVWTFLTETLAAM